jgi:hypothetical protein
MLLRDSLPTIVGILSSVAIVALISAVALVALAVASLFKATLVLLLVVVAAAWWIVALLLLVEVSSAFHNEKLDERLKWESLIKI